LYSYFEKNYIGAPRPAPGLRRQNIASPAPVRRDDPRYSIKFWNVFERADMELPRTNNGLAGWHNAFHGSVNADHPSTHALIKLLVKAENSTMVTATQLEVRTITASQRSNQEGTEIKIRNMIDGYNHTH
ncbi:unnamed protein product, partial [Didymodactylos carnosus]